MGELTFNPVGGYWLVALLAAGLLLPLWLIRPAVSRVTRRRWWALCGLRLGAIILALVATLRPTLIAKETRRQSSTLIVLIDVSRSMGVADHFAGKTRWQELRDAVEAARESFAALAADLELKVYTFDADPHEVSLDAGAFSLPDDPTGEQTAIGAVLRTVVGREQGQRVAGVILLSDGSQRTTADRDDPPDAAARELKRLGAPLHAVAFGKAASTEQARDAAVKELTDGPTVFVKNDLTVQAAARFVGMVNQNLNAEMWFETTPGKLERVASAPLRPREDGQRIDFDLNYVPQVSGEFKLTVKIPPQPGELVTTNNELSTFVTVLKGGLNVLYVEGALRIEQKFLRQALDASKDIKVDFVRLDPRLRDKRPPDLVDRFQPGKYDVYIIGDVDASQFQPAELAALAEAVQRGAGFIMLGGFHTFAPGGYFATPLNDVLPVEMDKLDRQNLGEPVRPKLHLGARTRIVPTRVGKGYPMLRLTTPDKNDALWGQLPPLDGANLFVAKQAALVLAESSDGKPLLVTQNFGVGRVLAFAGDTTWRWVMGDEKTSFKDAHLRFWRQTVLWLARKDESSEGSAWIKLPQRRYLPHQKVEFTAGARSPTGESLSNAQIEATITTPAGAKQPVRLLKQTDRFVGSYFDTKQPGDYAIEIVATNEGQPVGTARARFTVSRQDLELDNPAANPAALRGLAEMTGGQSPPPEQLSQLLEEIRRRPPEVDIERITQVTLWDTWRFFLILTGLLIAEWFLRKKWGLV